MSNNQVSGLQRLWSPGWIGAIAGVASVLIAAIALIIGERGPDNPEPRAAAEAGTHYFMYGTMMPGHLRYPAIDDFVATTSPDKISGRLFDSGAKYPAGKFGGGGEISGFVLRLSPDSAKEAAAVIAELEGNLFRPQTVKTKAGVTAIAYEFNGSTDGLAAIPSGVWDRPEE